MADLTITAASVIAGASARKKTGTAGATITAGKTVYLDAATNRYKLADCDDAAEAVRNVVGVALHASSDGQPLTVCERGPVTIGATLLPGVVYYLSPTAGGICPVADLSTGDYPVIVGIASSASVLRVGIQKAGVALT